MNSFRLLASSLIFLALAFVVTPAHSQVSISVGIAPPPLIVETQPVCPDDGYLWTPGYWAYDPDSGEYYWVPGAWVQPPQIGFVWTPCWWGWAGNAYVFHHGYWGSTCGFYGGVNYGHGYWGHGYGGGRWEGGHFAYNTVANNVNPTYIHNTYVDRSVVRSNSSRVSYNGGRGGIQAQPTARERQVAQQSHVSATAQQQAHFQAAAQTRSHTVRVNKAVAGNANATHTNTTPAVNKQDAAFTGGDKHAQKTSEAKLSGEKAVEKRTATASVTHHNETHVASQHTATHNSEVASSTHHVQKAAPTHTAQAAVHQPEHFNTPAVVHHSQASVPLIEHASAPHMSAPHASAPHAGGGGHSGGGTHSQASGGNKQH